MKRAAALILSALFYIGAFMLTFIYSTEYDTGKGEHISMKTLLRICGTLDCDIADVIKLEREDSSE